MSGKIGLAEGCGLTTLGESRNQAIVFNKDKFAKKMLEYLDSFEMINEVDFFKVVHLVWEEFRGHKVKDKKVIFYHIHNPNFVEYYRYLNSLNPKDLYIIRNWLQGLESWIYNEIPNEGVIKKIRELKIENKKFKKIYANMLKKIESRIFVQRFYWYLNNKNTAFVKLEDVKNSPEPTMRAVAKWMGISYDECLLRPEFMGLKFHSNKSKLNPTISEFDKKSIQRKVGVLFSEKDARLLNTVLRPWNEVFEYGEGEFKYLNKDEALKLNEEIMDWEKKLIDFFEIKEEDALKVIKYRKQKLKLALETEKQIFEELKKVELIKPRK